MNELHHPEMKYNPRAVYAVNTRSDDDRPVVRWFGRIGYVAKGVVYLTIGVLALMQVLGVGGGSTGSQGALVALNQQSYGDILLYLLAAGLVMYTLWRFAQSLFDIEDKGSEPRDLVKRGGLFISGALYAVLAWQGVRLAMDTGNSGADSDSSGRAAQAMSEPGGAWLVVAVGVGFAITGLYQLWRAWSLDFKKHWKSSLNGTTRTWATGISRFGIAARAVLFVITGYYIAVAGFQSDPEKTRGLGGVLRDFAGEPWLLGTAAAGLVCYAAYSWVNAIFRRIPATRS